MILRKEINLLVFFKNISCKDFFWNI